MISTVAINCFRNRNRKSDTRILLIYRDLEQATCTVATDIDNGKHTKTISM